MEYPWYTLVKNSEEILQGDLIPNCPILVPPEVIEVNTNPTVEVSLIDSIVLSQSCDLKNNKIEIVLVCPYFSLKEFLSQLPDLNSQKAIQKAIDNLKKGNFAGYHMLDKFDKYLNDYQVVDFKNVYGIQFEYLKTFAKNIEDRVRLLPPYREHLSQSFARYFMRVGLPQDIEIEGY